MLWLLSARGANEKLAARAAALCLEPNALGLFPQSDRLGALCLSAVQTLVAWSERRALWDDLCQAYSTLEDEQKASWILSTRQFCTVNATISALRWVMDDEKSCTEQARANWLNHAGALSPRRSAKIVRKLFPTLPSKGRRAIGTKSGE